MSHSGKKKKSKIIFLKLLGEDKLVVLRSKVKFTSNSPYFTFSGIDYFQRQLASCISYENSGYVRYGRLMADVSGS